MAKRSWPLVLLGLAAFIPGFGFVCGAAAVAWGLLSDRPRARLAVGLGAAGALLQLIVSVGLIFWLQQSDFMRQARLTRAGSELTELVAQLEAYKVQTGQYPPTLLALTGSIPQRLVNIHDHTAGLFQQQPYIYRLSRDGTAFDLFAVGPDGKPDTPDDVRPTLPDSTRAANGYRPGL